MRVLRQTIWSIAAILLLGVLVAPYFIGSVAKQAFLNGIQTLNTEDPYVTIIPQSYQRNWWQSKAQVIVNVHVPEGGSEFQHRTPLTVVIKHGPVFEINHHFYVGKAAIVIQNTTKDINGRIIYIIDWSNQHIISADMPFFSFSDIQGNHYQATGIHFRSRSSTRHTLETLQVQHLSMLAPLVSSLTLDVDHLTMVSNGKADPLWLGAVHANLDHVVLRHAHDEAPLAELNHAILNTFSSMDKTQTKFNSSLNLNIEKMTYHNQIIKPVALSYHLQNLNAAAYTHLLAAIDTKEGHLNPSDVIAALADIFESGFTLNIDRCFIGLPKEMASSPISIHAMITFNPIEHLSENPMASNPVLVAPLLMKAIHVKGQFSLPQNLVKEAIEMHYGPNNSTYDNLVSQHVLVPHTDGSTDVSVDMNKHGAHD